MAVHQTCIKRSLSQQKHGLDSKTWSALWFAEINFGPSPSTRAWSKKRYGLNASFHKTSMLYNFRHFPEPLTASYCTMPSASNFWSRKQNCCRCHRIVTSAMVGTAERLRHWAAQQLTFCLTQEIILIHINTHRIHVWYNGIYANIGGILMVNVTIYSIHGFYGL